MKYLLLLISIIVLSCSAINKTKYPCFPDTGIESVVIKATLLPVGPESKTALERHQFNQEGRIILREEEQRRTEFVYKSLQLQKTIVTNFSLDAISGAIDTNHVASVDEYGRPLTFHDGEEDKIEFIYKGCEEHIYMVKDNNGNLMDEITSFFKDGVLKKTVWKSVNIDESQVTKYYDYKFDKKGHWIERKYDYFNGGVVLDEREISYY